MCNPSKIEAIILAAGKGTRMRSLRPKVLHEVCGQPLLERVIRPVMSVNPSFITVVLGHGYHEVKSYLDRLTNRLNGGTNCIRDVLQEFQGGTGHAVQIASSFLDPGTEFVLILPGDLPLLNETTVKWFVKTALQENLDFAVLSMVHPSPASYGRVVRKHGKLERIVEARDCSPEQLELNEVNSSIYLCRRAHLLEALETLNTNNAQAELYLPDIIAWATEKQLKTDALVLENYLIAEGANTIVELKRLEQIKRTEIAESLMSNGVVFENPQAAYIDELCIVEPDVFIGANVRLKGKCHLKSGSVLEGDSYIIDSVIGNETRIKLGSYIENSCVGNACSVGPFAHLRPGTVVGNSVKIGNFVETKKSTLQDGVKAGHLSYLGDVTVGKDVNVGAGTITCNYDGKSKFHSEIGQGAFIGSNSCLVSPVVIGAGAYVGAGSVITSDVPEGSLGIGRARQKNIDGWTKKSK